MSQLLGYVFWHKPRPGVPPAEYETKLLAFQGSLKSHGPKGLVDALSFRLESRPWSKRRSRWYEDWYLVKGFDSLGAINLAAVATPTKLPHDRVARDAAGGAGGVYEMLGGDLPMRDARFATWVRKPARTTYQAFLDDLARLVASRKAAVWRRQMVLGPAPEFCLRSDARLELPSPLRATSLRVELVAAGRGGRP